MGTFFYVVGSRILGDRPLLFVEIVERVVRFHIFSFVRRCVGNFWGPGGQFLAIFGPPPIGALFSRIWGPIWGFRDPSGQGGGVKIQKPGHIDFIKKIKKIMYLTFL